MSNKSKLKIMPALETDQAAEDFIDNIDLTEYDLSSFKPVNFEFEPKTKQINMRMPESLIIAVKQKAKQRGIPYQKFIRETLEKALNNQS